MAKKKEMSELDAFASALIGDLNKQHKKVVAYNLGTDISPTHVTEWISTGSIQLDYDIANKPNGGLPVGRVVEIFGPPSIGKSHIAAQICKSAQEKGGVAVMIDSENATNPENLGALGVNIRSGFVYIDTSCTEEIFELAEETMKKARVLIPNKPVVIIWDSVAASSPRAELDGEYEKNTIGLQARALSKGFRKITHIVGENRVLFVCINQMRMKIGELYGDPWCVDPYRTRAKWRIGNTKLQSVMSNILGGKDCSYTFTASFDEVARYCDAVLGLDITDCYNPEATVPSHYNVEGYEPNEPLEYFDVRDAYLGIEGPQGYTRVTAYSVKQPVDHHFHLPDYNFYGAGGHKVSLNGNWVPLCEHPDAVRVNRPMNVVDVSTESGTYMAHGLVHHNTTPGGQAIPFHASVRIRLNSGKALTNADGNEVGILVKSQVKKNKVAVPFRKSEFEIHFGKGIVEHEQLFDVLRVAGAQTLDDGHAVEASGTGSWKQLLVNDSAGTVIVEKKFYKREFGEIMAHPEYGPWVEKLCEKALVRTTEQIDAFMQAKNEEEVEMGEES